MVQTKVLVSLFQDHPVISKLREWICSPCDNLRVKGLSGSSLSLIITALRDQGPHVVICSDKEVAAYVYHDIAQLNLPGSTFFIPSSYKRSPEFGQPDNNQLILRASALQCLRSAAPGNFFVTYPEALMERVPGNEMFENKTITIRVNEKVGLYLVADFLKEVGFRKADFVHEPGYFSIRGSILDVFSYSAEEPFRLDFFGDEIESIRSFDIETQLSSREFKEITIIPGLIPSSDSGYVPITEAILPGAKVWVDNPAQVLERMDLVINKVANGSLSKRAEEGGENTVPDQNQLISGKMFNEFLARTPFITWGNPGDFKQSRELLFNTSPQPLFRKQFQLLEENIAEKQSQGYRVIFLSGNKKQLDRLNQIFSDRDSKISCENINIALHEGFIDNDLKLCLYTDHQIFDRYHRFSLRTDKTRLARQSLSIKELTRLNPGDFVVHVDHGIGRFGGLVTLEENGHKQEAIQLIYRDNDVLLVNIHSLHRVSKYKGQDGEPPKPHKLGHAAWSKLKERTKKKVKDIARELITLYARRKAEPGFAFSPDTFMQSELEASFIYEDTPDQIKAVQLIKQDMESNGPMDRLVCGDVGFGKTEVAIRAAFKAVADNKQVAVLVPTTILALQHYHTFKERLRDFPCRVEHVSRLRKPAEVKAILSSTAQGKVDILIGTHRLIGKDVRFKDLGLLIVDEEHRFGVAVKEKLKSLKVNVDTLTLTATPIPRTLQFSLMGARDLSILNTPPNNRQPIFTELHSFNEEIIKEAIQAEIDRGGQVFFIHNRVQNILEIENLVKRLIPGVKTAVAHGKMDGSALEEIMLGFINGEFEVLVTTTIIESGLDIPNANTIIINNANQFGLSELHQLRGRVGRSNKKAYCFLIAPPLVALTNDAKRRLKIIEEFSDLGSGLSIAMQDLDIRGAGNLLGGEQSGYIADIGFETYQRVLEEALLELRENEFPFLQTQPQGLPGKNGRYVNDCIIETDADIRFPEHYISNTAERMDLYRELDNLKDESKIEEFKNNLVDRFGELPPEAQNLLKVVKARVRAENLGIEKLTYKHETLRVNFVSNQESTFYNSTTFNGILQWLQANHGKAKMEEKNAKLLMTIPGVSSVDGIINVFEDMETRFCAS